ncbi:MAG TPA: ATPase, T2SS/T4P/T4SS family [Polyangiaceae bacterium]
MLCEVVIDNDQGKSTVVTLSGHGPFSVGRNATSSIVLDSDLVSRQHAVVRLGVSAVSVEDVSTNGTIAGGTLLRRQTLEVPFGTPIAVGSFRLSFHRRKAEGVTPISSPSPLLLPPLGARARRPVGETALAQALGDVPAVDSGVRAHDVHRNGAGFQTVTPPSAAPRVESGPEVRADLRREVHRLLLEHLDLAQMDPTKIDEPSFRPRVLVALRRIIQSLEARLPADADKDALIGEMADEALGLGPLEHFLADPTVSEIMVIDANTIYVEQNGKIVLTGARFTDDDRVRAVIERIVTPLGRRIDESSPLVDARLKDGSRVNAIIRPLALKGSCITIRKFARIPITLDKMMEWKTLSPEMARFLTRSVVARKNIVISGGTGSGKTTLLNVLSAAIPASERIVTIEDAAELQLNQPHVVALETRPANMEGKGQYTIRELVRNALRMRPDRIVVGECRGGEALDMLQAMNTGHDGSLTTTHANSPSEAATRLETLCLMAGVELPARSIREQISKSINLIVQKTRLPDGTRKITAISEVLGLDEHDEVDLRPIFQFYRSGTGPNGEVLGGFRATGYLPSFLGQFIVSGFVRPGEPYL